MSAHTDRRRLVEVPAFRAACQDPTILVMYNSGRSYATKNAGWPWIEARIHVQLVISIVNTPISERGSCFDWCSDPYVYRFVIVEAFICSNLMRTKTQIWIYDWFSNWKQLIAGGFWKQLVAAAAKYCFQSHAGERTALR